MRKEHTILLLVWIGLVALCLSFSSCDVSLFGKMPEVKPPGDVAKRDSTTTVKKDSTNLKRYDSIIHSIDTVHVKDSLPPKFTDSLSMINYLKSQLDVSNGQVASLTEGIKQLKPEPCSNKETIIHEPPPPEDSSKEFWNKIANAVYLIIGAVGMKVAANKKKSDGHPQ